MSELGDVLKLPYAVDFDGVLAESVWPDRGIGPMIHENVEKLDEVAEAGHDIIIHSSRPWSDFKKVETWLQEHNIPYNGIILGKYLALKYIDDKALNSDAESWL